MGHVPACFGYLVIFRPADVAATGAAFHELFTPKLVTVLREDCGLARLRANALAGLTVAIVSLPLSMAIAIASGASPDRGLYTAIVGGFVVSALGGTIIRTATNVRSGAVWPVSGMLHSLFLLVLMRSAASLASYIPLAALAGLLAIVLRRFVDQARRHHVRVFIAGAVRPVRRVLIQQGLRPPSVRYAQSVAQAAAAAARSPEHAGT